MPAVAKGRPRADLPPERDAGRLRRGHIAARPASPTRWGAIVSSLIESLVLEGSTRIVLLVLDGLGDLPHPDHGFQTPLEAAKTPALDSIAARAAMGRLLPVAPGVTPGSGPGHLGLFGYDPAGTPVGRGVLEALGAGIELQHGDVAARANFCTVDAAGVVTDRRAGRMSGDNGARLLDKLKAAGPR